ncbi:hypothetical protein DUPY_24190 [Duganella phyllosphaerae]|uniref:Uncharacterized protein n=1 Tax=Duganella phyllosphaerae TaxID=762836 RepID=A0A1E7WMW3_9BURK|nr:hypothetical protein DUPY_24190 [Duganella phyllosphaerae]
MPATPAATPAPGENNAVYTSGLAVTAKPDSAPLMTTTSAAVKPCGASLKVNVISAVSPALSAARSLVMARVGGVPSTTSPASAPPMPALPALSL